MVIFGVGFVVMGYWMFSRGEPMVQFGGFRYPSWWHRLSGGSLMALGVLLTAIAIWKA